MFHKKKSQKDFKNTEWVKGYPSVFFYEHFSKDYNYYINNHLLIKTALTNKRADKRGT